MSNKIKSGLPSFVFALLCTTLTACNSTSHLFVKKTDLEALDQCLVTQQSQQQLFAQQLAQHEETIELLTASLEEQKKLAAIQPPPPPPQPRNVVCPRPQQPRPVQATNANDNAFQEKQLVGEKEHVLLNGLDIVVEARMDTGAATASLDARDIQIFERNGEDWVRFTVYNPETREPIEVERKRSRRVHIVQSGDDESQRRPVVEMRITVGKITQNAEFTLVDRSNLELPMLIGRNILRDVMLVDVSRSDIAPPKREEKKPEENAPESAKPAAKPKAEPKPKTEPKPKAEMKPKAETKPAPDAVATPAVQAEPASESSDASSNSQAD